MTRAYTDILYETKAHAARITINRPTQYNAFTGDTLKELTLAFEEAAADEEIGVIVPTGAGDKAFCAGGDVNWEKDGGLAYDCDFTLAAEHAIFGQNGPRVGSPACAPIVSYSARILGHKRARDVDVTRGDFVLRHGGCPQ